MPTRTRKQVRTQIDWTKTKTYASVALLATLLTATAAVLSTLSAHKMPQDQRNSNSTPPPTPTPRVVPDGAIKQAVCQEWTSSGSGKKYNFVCGPESSFDIFLIDTQGTSMVGHGTISVDGAVDGVISLARPQGHSRRAHITLIPSSDGQFLKGSYHGDDGRESGDLEFIRS